ncbi:hypothetical protein ACFOHS_16115 [Jhaorihella thermophila]
MMGNLTAAIWALGLLAAWWFSTPFPGLSEAVAWALADYPFMAEMLDPNSFFGSSCAFRRCWSSYWWR